MPCHGSLLPWFSFGWSATGLHHPIAFSSFVLLTVKQHLIVHAWIGKRYRVQMCVFVGHKPYDPTFLTLSWINPLIHYMDVNHREEQGAWQVVLFAFKVLVIFVGMGYMGVYDVGFRCGLERFQCSRRLLGRTKKNNAYVGRQETKSRSTHLTFMSK